MLDLRTLGTLDLHDGAAGVELRSVLAQPKRIGLLCYLALARPHGFHRRDKLLALFWPEADARHARASLRQAVRFLRRALGEEVVQSRGDEELALGEGLLTCDAVEFEQALAAGEPERALGLYGGDLLPGFYAEGAPEFEQWLEAERRHLRERAVAGAWAAADARERAHDAAGASEWARRASAMAPADDAALRRLMQLLDRVGDPDGALTAYREGVRRLRAEYEIDPSPETIRLGEEICDRVRATAAHLRARAVATAADEPPLSAAPVEAAVAPLGTPEALGQAPPPRRLVRARRWLVSAGLVVLAVSLSAGGWLWLRERPTSGLDPHRVLVAVFENETGDSSYSHLGRFAADYIIQALAGSDFATPIDARALPRVGPDSTSYPRVVRRLALENRAGTVVRGRYYLVGDSIYFDARITDAHDGRPLRGVEPVASPRSSVEPGVERLRDHVFGALAASLASWFTSLETRSKDRPPSYAAYREYAAGMDAYNFHGDWIGAAAEFERAAALDTTFLAPRIWGALSRLMAAWVRVNYNLPDSARVQLALADSLAAGVTLRRDRLNQYDRYFFHWYKAIRNDDIETAYEAAHQMVETAPGSFAAQRELLFAAMRSRRPREALRLIDRMDPKHRDVAGCWACTVYCAHFAGDYKLELERARMAQRLFPGNNAFVWHEMSALVGLGRVAEAEELLARNAGSLDGYQLYQIGLEMRAHGHPAASRRAFLRALAWARAQPIQRLPPGVIQPAQDVEADALFLLGREAEARPLYERFARIAPTDYGDVAFLGVIVAHAGDTARARQMYARLLADTFVVGQRDRDLFFARAALAAALGEREAAVLHASRMFMGWNYWHWWPLFDPLHGYPPFETLLRPKG